jgi:hypothetical protein
VDALQLSSRAAEQGELAEQLRQVIHQLEEGQSVVFSFVARQSAEVMDRVQAAMRQGRTDRAVQTEQGDIVRRLEQLMRALEESPNSSSPSQAQSDGAGGGGGESESAPVPPEAELRLLKLLQAEINHTTRELNLAQPVDQQSARQAGMDQGQLRQLLNEMIRRASGGKRQLDPEPDPKQRLPEEEAGQTQGPIADAPGALLRRLGDRMARSRQRLEEAHDPGPGTQTIQDHILSDLQTLMEQSRQRQAQAGSSSRSPGERPPPMPPLNQAPAAAMGVGSMQGENRGAAESQPPGPGDPSVELSQEMEQTAAEWGRIAPRLRDAILQGHDEDLIDDYRVLIEDYYRSLSQKASER